MGGYRCAANAAILLPFATMTVVEFDCLFWSRLCSPEFYPLDIASTLQKWQSVHSKLNKDIVASYTKKAFICAGPDFLSPWGDYRAPLIAFCRSNGIVAHETTSARYLRKVNTTTPSLGNQVLGGEVAISSWGALAAFRAWSGRGTEGEVVDWAVCAEYGTTRILFYGLTVGEQRFPFLINIGFNMDPQFRPYFDSALVVNFFKCVPPNKL